MKILFIGTGAADWVLKERKGDEFFRRLTAVKINDDLMIDCSADTSDFTAKNPVTPAIIIPIMYPGIRYKLIPPPFAFISLNTT